MVNIDSWLVVWMIHMGMDQYLLIPFLGGWTSINTSYWCEQKGYKVLTHPQISSDWWFGTWMDYFSIHWEFHHPNWRTPSFFRGVAQPPTRLLLAIINHIITINIHHILAIIIPPTRHQPDWFTHDLFFYELVSRFPIAPLEIHPSPKSGRHLRRKKPRTNTARISLMIVGHKYHLVLGGSSHLVSGL